MIQGMAVGNLLTARMLPPAINIRFWDTETTWKDIETAAGIYNFVPLQKLLIMANGAPTLYTFGKVPISAGGGANFANPPSDLAAGNATFKAFVTALVNFSLTNGAGRIESYELWNEPNLASYWTGTPAQLVQMVADAVAIIRAKDPLAIIVGPAGSGGTAVNTFMQNYYKAGGGALQDVFAYHAYLGDGKRTADGMQLILKDIAGKKVNYGLTAQPTWFTEGSWGMDLQYPNPAPLTPASAPAPPPGLTNEEKSAYMAMQHIYMWIAGVARYYWYQWDSTQGWGAMWSPTGINPVGQAYSILRAWLNGATLVNPVPVTNASGTSLLTLTLANGRAAALAWNPNVHSLSVAPTEYLTLDSPAVNLVKNGSVTVHPKPILLLD